MKKRLSASSLFFSTLALSLMTAVPAVYAETIELVTYYPAPSPDQHVRSLTVGTSYANETLNDGETLIYRWLGVGPGLTSGIRPPWPAPPTEPLWVVGNILALGPTAAGSNALFIADRAASDRLNGLHLRTNGVPQWTIGSRNDNTENLHIYSDASATPATRMFIEQATGNVGIGTTAPAGRLHVQGADDALSQVLFTAGQDLVPGAPYPDIRVGIGTAAPTSRLHVGGSLSLEPTRIDISMPLNDDTHNVVLCNNGGNITLTLPAANASRRGRTYYVKKISANSFTVRLDGGGALIDGQAALTLFGVNDAVRVICDGANWYTIGSEIPHVSAKMRRAASQTIANSGSKTPGTNPIQVLFDAVDFDMGGLADNPNDRFVIPADGVYEITAYWANRIGADDTEKTVWMGIEIAGVKIWYGGTQKQRYINICGSETSWLTTGQVVKMYLEQDSGSSITTEGSDPSMAPRMSVTRVR